MKTNTKYPSIGCYINGANQPCDEGTVRLIRLTEDFGRKLDRETSNYCRRVELDCQRKDDPNLNPWFDDEAVEWMNDNVSVPYAWWGWNDGDFGLWPCEIEDIKDEIGFVSVKSLADAAALGIETDPEDSDYPPHDYEGEWLHVSDHGNCTLYVREQLGAHPDGSTHFKDHYVWSVV